MVRRAPLERLYGLHICAILEAEQFFLRNGNARTDTGTERSEQSAKTTEYVNFRSGPGTNYSSKGVIASGTTVTVTDRSNSQWYAVRLANGSTGYIFAQYLKVTGTSSATPTPTQAPSNDGTVQAKLTADVNLRRGAGTNYGVIKVIGTGTTVTVTDASNSQWYKVKLSDGTEAICLRISESYFRQY